MKIKLLLTILLLAEIITANAQNAEKEYLKKVLTNLEKIESATYYVTNESWQPGDSTALIPCMASLKSTIIQWTQP